MGWNRVVIWSGIPISLLELFSRDHRFDIDDAINGEDSIQVIDFVLQQFREKAIVSRAEFENLAAQVLITDGDFAVPLHLHKDRQETQASVPDDDLFRAALDDFRVDQRPRLDSGKLKKDYALQDSNLRGGDASAVACSFAPVSQRVAEVLRQQANLAGCRIADRQRLLPQDRIAELKKSANGHGGDSVGKFYNRISTSLGSEGNWLSCGSGIEQIQKIELLFRRQEGRFERIPGQFAQMLVGKAEGILRQLILARERR